MGMIKHEYVEPIPAVIWKEKAEPIFIAAGKYGFRQLKLQADWHVKNLKLTANNEVDASMEFIITNADKHEE